MARLETIYERLTGLDPKKDLEPPLRGQRLAKAIHQLRNPLLPSGDIFQLNKPIAYEMLESGVEAEEKYTLVGRRFEDGRLEAAFVFGVCLEPNKIAEFAEMISPRFWIPYTEENRREF